MKDISKIDDIVYDALSDFSGEPSPQVISQIRKKMYFSNLVTRAKYMFFNPATLISVISVSAVITLALIYLPLDNQTEKPNTVADNKPAEVNVSAETVTPSSELNATTDDQSKSIDETITSEKINNISTTDYKENIKSNNVKTSAQTNAVNENNSASKVNNSNFVHKEKTQTENTTPIINKSNEEKTTPVKNETQLQEKTIKNELADNNQKPTENQDSDREINTLPNRNKETIVLNNSSVLITENKTEDNKQDVVNLTSPEKTEPVVVEKPVVIENTKITENKETKTNSPDSVSGGKNNDYAGKSSFSIEANFAYGKVSSVFSGNQSMADLSKNAIEKPMLMSGGLGVNYHLKNWTVQSGFSYSLTKEKFNYSEKETSLDTSYHTETIDVGYFEYDSVIIDIIVEIDSMGSVDTIFIWDTDTVWIPVDSTYTVMDIDSLLSTNPYNILNRYTYLEIPLIFGYEFGNKKLTFPVKLGLITGIFLNAQGKGFLLNGENTVTDLQSLPFMKINFHAYFCAGINYRLSNNYCIFAEGYLRKQLNSTYKSSYPVSKKQSIYGLKAGLRYNF